MEGIYGVDFHSQHLAEVMVAQGISQGFALGTVWRDQCDAELFGSASAFEPFEDFGEPGHDDSYLKIIHQNLLFVTLLRRHAVAIGRVCEPAEVLKLVISGCAVVLQLTFVEVVRDELADVWKHAELLAQRALHVHGQVLEQALDHTVTDQAFFVFVHLGQCFCFF